MMGFVTFNDEAEQYLCAAVLRPGNVTAATGAVGIVRRLMALVRNSFSKVRIRVRLDGGFANPELLAFLDSEPGVEYVVAMASNAVLNRKAEEAMQVARLLAGLTDQTEHVYGEASYAAGSWERERRVIIKAEVVRAEEKAPKDNPRFVITNMKQTPQWLYEHVYRQRGEIGVSSQGHINQSVRVRPRLTDSSLVAWEASWSESEMMEPSDNMLRKEYAQLTRL